VSILDLELYFFIDILFMDYRTLSQKFKDKASEITDSGSSSAVYRSRSYDRVATKIDGIHPAEMIVTESGINNLGLTDYMTGIATDLLKGKNMKKVKVNRKVNRKVNKASNVNKASKVTNTNSKAVTKKTPVRPMTTAQANKLLMNLTGFMGIGPDRAQSLIDDGITTVIQLYMKKWLAKLPEETQLYLKLKPSQTIPHADIKALEKYLKCSYDISLVGSYRRKKSTSRDIDIMISSTDEDIIEKYLRALKKKLTVYPYSQGKDKMSLILDCTKLLGKSEQCVYKLDVFRVEPENKIPMLLYATGSKEFNITMRSIAKKKGFLLNQKGIFRKKSNGETEKVKGLKTEKDYFDTLSMAYLEPDKR
jgi:predicted flap endonuclease-1-like 5' DNA nuclease/predicted nucleotidyltransferase